MRKRIALLVLAVIVLAMAAGSALDAIRPGSATPAQIVQARQAAMFWNIASFGEIKAKAAAGNVKGIAVNARGMMVAGAVIPTVLTDRFMDAYPPGYKFYFKGGDAADIADKAQGFINAAEALAIAADKGDTASIEPLTNALFASCGACHASYRGSM
jgi:hypothetical protein